MFGACTATPPPDTPAGNVGYVDLQAIKFIAKDVTGNVEYKPHKNAEWQRMKNGDVFSGFGFIRSGIRSHATLVMKDNGRSIECEVGGLVCETGMNNIYEKLLCPTGCDKYFTNLWGKKDRLVLDAPIKVCRDTLNGEEAQVTLLAEAGMGTQITDQRDLGAAGAASGSAPGGGGTGGGGCGPGG